MPKTSSRLSATLRDKIEELIATGVFNAGEKIDEASLTKRFRVSRTPVREALAYLAATGLVEVIPNRGCFVKAISHKSLIQMFEGMAEMEASIASLAARRLTDNDEKAILAAHKRCKAALAKNDSDSYFSENEDFHFAIYRACHNDFLIGQAVLLFRRLKPYRRMQLRVRGRVRKSFDEHQRIVDAILAGNGERAASELRNHVLVQGERFADIFAHLAT
jgi:DNA-binding GntR family transcriptional regulator